MIDNIQSVPFQIYLGDIVVVKVISGDGFQTVLSAMGQVYSWGYNSFGQLGIN